MFFVISPMLWYILTVQSELVKMVKITFRVPINRFLKYQFSTETNFANFANFADLREKNFFLIRTTKRLTYWPKIESVIKGGSVRNCLYCFQWWWSFYCFVLRTFKVQRHLTRFRWSCGMAAHMAKNVPF